MVGEPRAIGDRALRRAALVVPFLMLAVAGCASLPPLPPVEDQDYAWALAGAGQPLGDAALEESAALLRVSEDMRRFALDATARVSSHQRKAKALVVAIGSDGGGLHVRYDPAATLTAEQVFAQRRANCLSYTLLFVALAREAGLSVSFNEVDVPPIWDLGDDQTLMLYKHVNARVDLGWPAGLIVDVAGDEYDPHFFQRTLSDAAVLAEFYNNRAAELRMAQRTPDALRYQLRALELAPDAAFLWSNLAGLYLATGNPRAARVAVTRALTLDGSDQLAYDTAAQAYEQLGQQELAAQFLERARWFLEQNPNHHYQLALAALNRHDEHGAYEEARRAAQLEPKEGRFYFLLALVLDRLGETQLARQNMQAALELTPDAAQQERYRSKFARLARHS